MSKIQTIYRHCTNAMHREGPVSYTHLDVYKRQVKYIHNKILIPQKYSLAGRRKIKFFFFKNFKIQKKIIFI